MMFSDLTLLKLFMYLQPIVFFSKLRVHKCTSGLTSTPKVELFYCCKRWKFIGQNKVKICTTFVLSFSFPSWKSTISPIKHRCRFQKIFHQLIKGFYNFYLVPWFGKMRKIKCIYQVEVSCYCCLMFCIFFNPKVWLEERPYVFIRFSQVYLQLRWLICLKECFF